MKTQITTTIDSALALHRSGQLREAARLYGEALAQAPQNVDALCYLAMVHCQQGQFSKGVDLLRDAVKLAPQRASAHNLLGMAYHRLGQFDAAIASLDVAIARDPSLADAHGNRAAVLLDFRRYPEAIESCDRALALMPHSVTEWCTRGAALAALARHEEAVASYDQALVRVPHLAEAHFNRGQCLAKLKRYEEALNAYSQALAIRPAMAEAFGDQGNVLQRLGRLEEALASYDRAIALAPDYAEAFCNRGNALSALQRHEEALASYDRAVALKPRHAEALHHRGIALGKLGRTEEALADFNRASQLQPDRAEFVYMRAIALGDLLRSDEALACCDHAIELDPNYADAYYFRGYVLNGLGRLKEALASFDQGIALNPDPAKRFSGGRLYVKMRLCDWRDLAQDSAQLISAVENERCAVQPFIVLLLGSTPEQQLKCARHWGDTFRSMATQTRWRGDRYAHDRIRLAYLSSDLRSHPTGVLTAGLFEQHDRSRFEVIALSTGPDEENSIRLRLRSAFDQFHDVKSRSDPEIAKLIRDLEVDIAVDLNGYTEGSRPNILARRPAPIQVNYLGYPGTMGANHIDYIIGDATIIPFEQQPSYSEKVVYLPHTYQVNDEHRRIPQITPSRSDLGLPDNGFVFCSFNNSYKINPTMFDIWMRLVHAIEGSALWLLTTDASVRDNLRREAQARGVAPDRLVFAPFVKLDDHLVRHRLADLFLDTLPCNAHTTASDALWAGLPVVTCLGSTFPGRVAASLLNAVGLPELVAHSLQDYEALALELARNSDKLASLKSKLARNRLSAPLFDTGRFARHIESAYTTMWDRYRRGEPPTSFSVSPIP